MMDMMGSTVVGEVTPEENLLSPPVASKEQSVASSYVPVFIDEIIAEDLPPGTIELCGSNKQCQFDYQVTGKESVAKSTAAFTNKFEAIREELEKKGILFIFWSVTYFSLACRS